LVALDKIFIKDYGNRAFEMVLLKGLVMCNAQAEATLNSKIEDSRCRRIEFSNDFWSFGERHNLALFISFSSIVFGLSDQDLFRLSEAEISCLNKKMVRHCKKYSMLTNRWAYLVFAFMISFGVVCVASISSSASYPISNYVDPFLSVFFVSYFMIFAVYDTVLKEWFGLTNNTDRGVVLHYAVTGGIKPKPSYLDVIKNYDQEDYQLILPPRMECHF